jgi:superfamily II DNA or RNA helicase
VKLTVREARTSYEGTGKERKQLYRILRVSDKSAKWRALQFLRSVNFFTKIRDKKERKEKVEQVKAQSQWIKFYDRRSRTFASGLLGYVREHYPGELKIRDLRKPLPEFKLGFKEFDFNDKVETREEQLGVVRSALSAGRGILFCATNFGKTEAASAIAAEFKRQTGRVPKILYLIHQISVARQTAERFEKHLGGRIPTHMVGAGRKSIPKEGILVSMVQTGAKLLKRSEFKKFLAGCDILFFDEFHINKAHWATQIAKFCGASMRFGLSGTIDKNSKTKMLHYQGLTGPIIAEVRNKELVDAGRSARPEFRFIEVDVPEADTYMESYRIGIVRNKGRNNAVVNEVLRYLGRDKKSVLVTVLRIKHGLKLLAKLERCVDLRMEFISGKTPLPLRDKAINDFKRGRVSILIVSSIFNVGMDIPEIDAWINAAGGKGWELVLQRLGRALRRKEGENKVYVSDFIDRGNTYLFRHSLKRLKYYQKEQIGDIKIITREGK